MSPWVQTQADGDASSRQQTIDDPHLTTAERTGRWADMAAPDPIQPRTIRIPVPRHQQDKGMLSVGLETAQLRRFWRLSGVTLEVEPGLQRAAKK